MVTTAAGFWTADQSSRAEGLTILQKKHYSVHDCRRTSYSRILIHHFGYI